MMDPTLSVVVPVRNEAGNIVPLIEEIHAALDGKFDFEVIYVDDGSTDGTADELGEARTRFPRLSVVRHEESCGQSTAIWTGAHVAKGEWIVTLDGDGQNDPADIPALVEVARTQGNAPGPRLDLVTGIRRKRRDSTIKRISSRIANGVRQWWLKDGVTDTGCGLKMLRREAFLALPYFDHMHRYYAALIIRGGGRVACVDVNHRPRRTGTSNYGTLDRLWVGITDLFGVAWLIKRNRRPRVAPAGAHSHVAPAGVHPHDAPPGAHSHDAPPGAHPRDAPDA